VNTVFCSENQNAMNGIIDYVRGLPYIKTHTISLVRGSLADKRYGNVDAHKYFDAVRTLEQNLKEGKSPVYRFRALHKGGTGYSPAVHPPDISGTKDHPRYAGRLNGSLEGRSFLRTAHGIIWECGILDTAEDCPFGDHAK
jgi:hypothetical protein